MKTITWILPTIKWDKSVPNKDENPDGMKPETALASVGGFVKQDSCELVSTDGEVKEAKDVRGEIVDRIQLDGNYEFNFTLIAQTLAEMGTIFGQTVTDSLELNNTMLKGYKYVVVSPDEEGQIQATFPYSRVYTGIGYNGTDGYYMPVRVVPMIPPYGKRIILTAYKEEE